MLETMPAELNAVYQLDELYLAQLVYDAAYSTVPSICRAQRKAAPEWWIPNPDALALYGYGTHSRREGLGYVPTELPSHLEAVEHHRAHKLCRKLWERVAAIEERRQKRSRGRGR